MYYGSDKKNSRNTKSNSDLGSGTVLKGMDLMVEQCNRKGSNMGHVTH